MGKFIKNALLITAVVNFAASVWYLVAGVVPLGVFWESTVACVKAGWPGYLLLLGVGASLAIPRIGSVARYGVAGTCFAGAMYFAVVSNVAFYRVIFTHTSVMSLALAALWLYAASAIVGYVVGRYSDAADKEFLTTRFYEGVAFREKWIGKLSRN